MVKFIGRRLAISVALLLGASFIMYLLVTASGDPLQDLKENNDPNVQQLIADRVKLLRLDVPAPLRYFFWLGGAARCLIPLAHACDLGVSVQNQQVTQMLPVALASTLRLLIAATVLAVLVGVLIGIVSALRQHTGFDYTLTFLVFLIFSLPSFFLAVLLKEFLAIGFNDFLAHPRIPTVVIIVLAVLSGVVWQSIVAGDLRRRAIVFGIGAAGGTAILVYISASGWLATPSLGPVVIAAGALAAGALVASVTTGLRSRRAALIIAICVALLVAGRYALQPLFAISTWATVLIVGLVIVAVCAGVGLCLGGPDRRSTAWLGGITGLVGYLLVIIDRLMLSWPTYVALPAVGGRPIGTVGAANPTVQGDIWITGIDHFTHYLLPTVALVLVSVAAYTRYVRSGMLEVLNQDYIRTAKAKGLSEPVVVMRHAFRNSLIPLATYLPVDMAKIVGGAVITEQVFSIDGMGQLFIRSLQSVDPNPVMAYFLVVAGVVLLANLLADISYAVLDPRIRLAR